MCKSFLRLHCNILTIQLCRLQREEPSMRWCPEKALDQSNCLHFFWCWQAPIFCLKSFDMDSVQVSKTLFCQVWHLLDHCTQRSGGWLQELGWWGSEQARGMKIFVEKMMWMWMCTETTKVFQNKHKKAFTKLVFEPYTRLALNFANCFLAKAGQHTFPCLPDFPIEACLQGVRPAARI